MSTERLYVSDLDGTLLRPDATLSPYARDALNRMLDAGLPFTIASARSAFSMRGILDGLRLRLPVIEHNGGYVTQLWDDEMLVSRPMHRQAGASLIAEGHARGIAPVISTLVGREQRIYVPDEGLNGGQVWFRQERERLGDTRMRPGIPAGALPDDELMGLTFIADQEALRPLAELAAAAPLQHYFYENRYDPGWHWLTVHAAEATKGHGLRFLTEHLGISTAQVTVFGDEINDLPMFATAGEAIAVDNALPAVKRAAHRVIGAASEDAVVRYLESVMEDR